eukprot:1634458-Rhodomonas_salina.1
MGSLKEEVAVTMGTSCMASFRSVDCGSISYLKVNENGCWIREAAPGPEENPREPSPPDQADS